MTMTLASFRPDTCWFRLGVVPPGAIAKNKRGDHRVALGSEKGVDLPGELSLRVVLQQHDPDLLGLGNVHHNGVLQIHIDMPAGTRVVRRGGRHGRLAGVVRHLGRGRNEPRHREQQHQRNDTAAEGPAVGGPGAQPDRDAADVQARSPARKVRDRAMRPGPGAGHHRADNDGGNHPKDLKERAVCHGGLPLSRSCRAPETSPAARSSPARPSR